MRPGLGPLFDHVGQVAAKSPGTVPGMRVPAANADPTTSWDAAERLISSGRLHAGVVAVVDALVGREGMTSRELAEAAGMDRHEVARRLADGRRLGLVDQAEKRRCRSGGLMSVTWVLTRDGRHERNRGCVDELRKEE